jgi:hypothetical protein
MMKKFLALLCVVSLCMGLLVSNAYAFTVTELDSDEVFSPELIEKEKISNWAKSEIELAREAGLITEHTSSYMTYEITRFQFAELIVNCVEKITGKEIVPAPATTFTDTTETAVLKAYAAGIVGGVGNNRFDPAAKSNREQIAAMIYRAAKYIQAETSQDLLPATTDLSKFTDKAHVSSWALEGVGALAANGVMSGNSATTLSPKSSCTIEQSILFVYRLYKKTV